MGRFQTPTSQFQVFKNRQPQAPRPKIYPNNTLVEDLSKCHQNLWPRAARVTSKSIEFIKSCLPKKTPHEAPCDSRLAAKGFIGPQNGFVVDLEQRQHSWQTDVLRQPAAIISNGQHQRAERDCLDGCERVGKFETITTTTTATVKKQQATKKGSKSRRLAPNSTRMRRDMYKFPMPLSILKLNSTVSIHFEDSLASRDR